MNEYQDGMPDTQARKGAERHIEQVRQQGGIFVEAVRVTRMPMLVTDATLPGNPITFANKAFAELSGYTVEEMLGQDPHFLNGPETDPDTIRAYTDAIASGESVDLEVLQYRKDGSTFRAMLFAVPLDDGQGTVTNHFLSYLDITRRFESEQQLQAMTAELEARVAARTRDLNAAKDKLSALLVDRERLMVEVNHRAKNSLAIAASLLGIQGRRHPDPAVGALFQEAHDRLNAMARVHDLLSRSESEQRVHVANYVRDLCEALRPITGSDSRVRLEADVAQGILVEADIAVPLGIVITELVTNAVKHAFPPPMFGSIVVQLRPRSHGAELLVRDDGVGMLDARQGSLGFGLVRSLVEQINGAIETRSERGLTVSVTFPAFAIDHPHPPTHAQEDAFALGPAPSNSTRSAPQL